MVSLETNLSLLKRLVGKPFTPKELEEILFNMGLELEEVSGDVIKVDITPDRPDLVSPQGLARALRAYLGLKNPLYLATKSNFKVIIDASVAEVRPFTVCAVVKNIPFTNEKIKEIIWVQEKLHATFGRNRHKVAIGIYPLDKITFPVRFLAQEPHKIKFRPLGSAVEMDGLQILKEHPAGKEYARLLEGKKKFPYFCDADGKILSLPPIINSHETGRVTENTTDLFIECSGFDFPALSQVLNILVYLFQDFGGSIYSVQLEYPDHKISTPHMNPEKRKIKVDFIQKMIGVSLSAAEIAACLQKMMYTIIKTEKNVLTFEVPSIRTDIWHDVDIVDEVVRGYGVNRIVPELPKIATAGKVLFENRISKQLSEILIGLNFQEVVTFGLTDKDDQFKKMNLAEQPHLKLGHTAEQSINMVRTWMLPELLKTIQQNRSAPLPYNLFEINYVVLPDKTKDVLSRNVLKLAAVISSAEADFTAIRQVIMNILELFGFTEIAFTEIEPGSFIKGRAAEIIVNKKKIGIAGEFHPLVLDAWDLKNPVSGFEIDVYTLFGIEEE